MTLFDWRFVFYLAPHLYIFVVLDTPLFPQLLDFVPCLRGNLKDLRQNKGLSQMIMFKKKIELRPPLLRNSLSFPHTQRAKSNGYEERG